MADSRRLRILLAIQVLLQGILVANGYRTNLGQKVYLGEAPQLGPDDYQLVVAILPKEDDINQESLQLKSHLVLPVDIAFVVSPALEEGVGLLVEHAIADVKQAMEANDPDLMNLLRAGRNNTQGLTRGTTETYSRMSGSDFSGALITYLCKYDETWGQPEA